MSRAAIALRGLAVFQLAAFAASAALIAALLAPVPVQLRFLVAVVFVVFGPGAALLSLVGSRFAETAGVGLVAALGMAITAICSQLILWSGYFAPRTELVVAAAVVMVVVAFAWHRRRTAASRQIATADASPTDGAGGHEQPMSLGEGG